MEDKNAIRTSDSTAASRPKRVTKEAIRLGGLHSLNRPRAVGELPISKISLPL